MELNISAVVKSVLFTNGRKTRIDYAIKMSNLTPADLLYKLLPTLR